MIEAKNIVKHYGSLQVLRGVDVTIAQGEVVSIVGPSGAGKTTLLKAISGETDHEGNIELVGGFKNIGWLKQEIDEKFSVLFLFFRKQYF